MKTNKLKKIYSFELQRKYKKHLGLEPTAELDYRLRNFFEELCEGRGIYEYDYTKRETKLRITFPLFFLVILVANIFSCFKWLFTGSFRFNNKSWFVRNMVKWDKYCGFNII